MLLSRGGSEGMCSVRVEIGAAHIAKSIRCGISRSVLASRRKSKTLQWQACWHPLTSLTTRTAEFLAFLRTTFSHIYQLPIPTISALSSVALGGGLELALTTDFRVFASTAVVGLPETRLGIIPGAGGTYRLPALIGTTRAKDLILTGRRIAGPEAYVLGICDRLVEVAPEDQTKEGVARELVMQEALRLATEICEGGPLAIRAAKKAVEAWQVREAERMAYDDVVATEDRNEALLAFREKRKAVFKGR